MAPVPLQKWPQTLGGNEPLCSSRRGKAAELLGQTQRDAVQKPWQLEREGLTGPEEGRTRMMEVLDSRAVSAAGPAPGGLADTSWGFGLCPVLADLKAESASTEGHQGVAAGLCIPSSRERLLPSKLPCQGQQVHNISRPSLSPPPQVPATPCPSNRPSEEHLLLAMGEERETWARAKAARRTAGRGGRYST